MKVYESLAPPRERDVTSRQTSVLVWMADTDHEEEQDVQDELKDYLSAPISPTSTDVLAWWKEHSGKYPCLARIARDYLAISATSAPVERVFSGGTNLISRKRGP